MPLNEVYAQLLNGDLRQLYEDAARTGDLAPVERRLADLSADDPHMQPYAPKETGTKYYKTFVQAVVPKILETLRRSFLEGSCPEIELTFDEADAVRARLGIPQFGSPQDFLYVFTSQRGNDWGVTLPGMGFQSACMIGQGAMMVTMAPRLLNTDNPDLTVQELDGAIATEFWTALKVVFGETPIADVLSSLLSILKEDGSRFEIDEPTPDTAEQIAEFLRTCIREDRLPHTAIYWAKRLEDAFQKVAGLTTPRQRQSKAAALLRTREESPGNDSNQEQIGLKYVEEGKFLQKLLHGARVEHLQSNVKMVSNPMRKNKCEVDSIYTVVGERRIILVESKGSTRVSRAQLYQLYETYRLKLPLDWRVEVVAALLNTSPSAAAQADGISAEIDLILIDFDENSFGKITESLVATKPKIHYRWQIKRQRPQR